MAARKEKPLEPALAFLRELWALDHALGSTSKRMHDRMGITAEQRMVLRFVGKSPRMTAGELASMLHVEKSTLADGKLNAVQKAPAEQAAGPKVCSLLDPECEACQ